MKLRKILASVVAVAMVASVAITASANTKTLAGQAANTKEITVSGQTNVSMGTSTSLTLSVNSGAQLMDSNDQIYKVNALKEIRVNGALPDNSGNWTVSTTGWNTTGHITAGANGTTAINVTATFEAVERLQDGTIVMDAQDNTKRKAADFGSVLNKDDLNLHVDDALKSGGLDVVGLTNATPVGRSAVIEKDLFGSLSNAEKIQIAQAGNATLEVTVSTALNDQTIQIRNANNNNVVAAQIVKDGKATINVPSTVFAETWEGGAAPTTDKFDLSAQASQAVLGWGSSVVDGAVVTDEEGGAAADDEGDDEGETDDGGDLDGDEWPEDGDMTPEDGIPADNGGVDVTDGGSANVGGLTGADVLSAVQKYLPGAATINADGSVYDAEGNFLGTVRADGTVLDANGNVLGNLRGGNPPTGVALAVVPAIIAGAAVVVARKRK